jgi:hypothetical protein
VPEPATVALFGLGLPGVAGFRAPPLIPALAERTRRPAGFFSPFERI